jgi:hypothetical protein
MTTTLKKVFLGAAAKIHTIHPALVLPLVAAGSWLITPALGIGDPEKPGPIDQAVATVRSTIAPPGSKPADVSTEPVITTGMAPPAPAPATPEAGGGLLRGLFGGNQSGNAGGGAGNGGGKSSAQPKQQPQTQASLPSKPATTGTATPHPATPSMFAGPRPMPTPNTPPVAATAKPAVPAPSPPVMAQPAPAPARLLLVPFVPRPFFRPPIMRVPFVVARHR